MPVEAGRLGLLLGNKMTLVDALRELRSRNEPVPLPMRLPTAAEVDDAERRLGVSFQASLR